MRLPILQMLYGGLATFSAECEFRKLFSFAKNETNVDKFIMNYECK